MAKRKSYDDKFRASAVVMLQAAGYPDKKGALQQVANHLKVSRQVLTNWAQATHNAPPQDVLLEKKTELADLFENAARIYLGHAIQSDVVAGVAGQSAVTAAAIATDKMQLLRGLPTAVISILPQVVKALEAAGYDPVQVFNDLIVQAAERQQELSEAHAGAADGDGG